MNIQKLLFVSMSLLTCLPTTAPAGNIPVKLYNNDSSVTDVSSALDFNVVSTGASTVRFTFQWNSTELGNLGFDSTSNYGGIRIAQFAIVDGIFVEPASNVHVTAASYDFIQRVGDDVKGAGNLFKHELLKDLVSFELQEDSGKGEVDSALDASDVPLVIDLTLKTGNNFATVEEYLESGQLRIGVHVISNGVGSQVYISGPPPSGGDLVVPEPASILLLTLGGLGLLAYRRRQMRLSLVV